MPLHVPARALVVALIAMHGLAQRADAQAVDTSHKWSLFGGVPLDNGTGTAVIDANQFGLSREFSTPQFPLALRGTFAMTHIYEPFSANRQNAASLALDAIARTKPLLFGTRFYALGGVGAETVAPHSAFLRYVDPVANQQFGTRVVDFKRNSYLFAQGGLGMEFRRMFLEARHSTPMATNGPSRTAIVLGIHF